MQPPHTVRSTSGSTPAPVLYVAAPAAWPMSFHQMGTKLQINGFEFNLRVLAGFHLEITCCCQQRFPPPVISLHCCASQPTARTPTGPHGPHLGAQSGISSLELFLMSFLDIYGHTVQIYTRVITLHMFTGLSANHDV